MNKVIKFAALAATILAVPQAARAQQLGVDFATPPAVTNNGAYTIGWSFSVSSPFTIDGLGFYDLNLDGFSESHDVGLWTGAGVLVASATVTSSDPLVSFWRFHDIAPISLSTGIYVLGGATGTEGYLLPGGTGLTFDPNVTRLDGVFAVGTALTFPGNSTGGFADDNWTPNFREAAASVTPEPASMLLMGTGLVSLAGMRRKRRA